MSLKKLNKGFTLIEILVVIGIIAVLATIVVVAINPARQFAQARNTQRISNVETILNAIGQNLADNKGVFTCTTPTMGTIPVSPTAALDIGTPSSTTIIDLSCLVPTYIPSAIPVDPTDGTPADTKYTVQVNSTGRYTICAPLGKEDALPDTTDSTICLTR